MLSPKIKRNISRIIPFGVFWVIFGLIFSIIENGVLGDLDYYPSTNNPYDFSGMIFINASSSLVTGLLFGTIESWFKISNQIIGRERFKRKR